MRREQKMCMGIRRSIGRSKTRVPWPWFLQGSKAPIHSPSEHPKLIQDTHSILMHGFLRNHNFFLSFVTAVTLPPFSFPLPLVLLTTEVSSPLFKHDVAKEMHVPSGQCDVLSSLPRSEPN